MHWQRVLLLLVVLVVGCRTYATRRVSDPCWLDNWRESVVQPHALSQRAHETLIRAGLADVVRERPTEAIAALRTLAVQDGNPDYWYALAELHFLAGQHSADAATTASGHFLLSAGYAYHFLLHSTQPQAVFDPRFRLACDLYNASVTRCLRAAQWKPGAPVRITGPDGPGVALTTVPVGFLDGLSDCIETRFCEDYAAVGFATQQRTYGLGVPLIGLRVHNTTRRGDDPVPRPPSFPLTALLHFHGDPAEYATRPVARLELYNTQTIRSTRLDERVVPLETDLTTPLAELLSRTHLNQLAYKGFFDPDRLRKRMGLYLLQPYEPGKIPVVLVHGLLSSPMTWAPLFNELQADPELSQRYQFWTFFYPTGTPFVVTAADFRASLAKMRAALDPTATDPAWNQMVCVGHSMGGLISRLALVDGGDTFFRTVSPVPLAQLPVQPATHAELERVFYFPRTPAVQRVVCIGTPNRGSKLIPSWPTKLVNHLIRLPQRLQATAHEVMSADPELAAGRLPTSVDLLAPDSVALNWLNAQPTPAGVHVHTIYGLAPRSSLLLERIFTGSWGDPQTDGVVPVSSAQLPTAVSQLAVPADHFGVHQHPLAIREVRRILLEHLRTLGPRE
jgi:pimeloyl-ACP methyl ester carboxylesterase